MNKGNIATGNAIAAQEACVARKASADDNEVVKVCVIEVAGRVVVTSAVLMLAEVLVEVLIEVLAKVLGREAVTELVAMASGIAGRLRVTQ